MEKVVCQGIYQLSEDATPLERITAMAVKPEIKEIFRDEDKWTVAGIVEVVIEGECPREKNDEIDDTDGLMFDKETEVKPFTVSIQTAGSWQVQFDLPENEKEPDVEMELKSHEAWLAAEGIEWSVELALELKWPEEQIAAEESIETGVEELTEMAPWLKDWVEVKPVCSEQIGTGTISLCEVKEEVKENKEISVNKIFTPNKQAPKPIAMAKGRAKVTMYFVKEGDSWETIARHYGIGEEILKQRNPGCQLLAGSVLWVPRG